MTPKQEQKLAREAVRAYFRLNYNDNRPVTVIDGASPPTKSGKGWHYTNKSGEVIRHPSAYMRKFGRPIYHASTRSYTVGRDWLASYSLAPEGELFTIISDHAQDNPTNKE